MGKEKINKKREVKYSAAELKVKEMVEKLFAKDELDSLAKNAKAAGRRRGISKKIDNVVVKVCYDGK